MNLYKGSRQFIDRSFPLACRHHESHGPLDLHCHDFHELVVILSGTGLHLADNKRYPIQAGDVFLVNGDMAHGYGPPALLSLVNILFDPHRLRLPLDNLSDVPGYQALFHVEPHRGQHNRFRHRLRLPPDALAEVAGLIARLENELDRKALGYRFAAVAYLMNLIDLLARRSFTTKRKGKQPMRKMSEVLSFIDAHYPEPIRLDCLMRMAGMSKSGLTRSFHKIMGCSPIEHILHVRVDRAAKLLLIPGARVTETAFACGFADSNYFARQFRRIMGISPSQYRTPARKPRHEPDSRHKGAVTP